MPTFWESFNQEVMLWLVLLIVFLAVELVTIGLTSIWFAAGALVALVIAGFGGGIGIQAAAFLAVSIILIAATRPFAQRIINSRTQKTNKDALIGTEIVIREPVNNRAQTGTAFADGKEWTVRSTEDGEVLEEGTLAKVVSISGVKLIVERIRRE
ncbi:MAG: NfeD family protein [Clostridiales bacterium]|nr:NfeD family protein [Clostridiales bacterium]